MYFWIKISADQTWVNNLLIVKRNWKKPNMSLNVKVNYIKEYTDSLTFVSTRTAVQILVCHSGHMSVFAEVCEVTAQQGGSPREANRPFK